MSYFLDLSVFPETSPEASVYRFLEAWVNSKWDVAIKNVQKSWVITQNDPLGALRAILSYNLRDYKVLESTQLNPVVCAVTVILTIGIARGVTQNKTVAIRTISEIQPLLPSPDGEWGINPITATMEIFDDT